MFDYTINIIPKQLDLFLLESKIQNPSYIKYFKEKIDQGVLLSENNDRTRVKGEMTDWKYFNEDEIFHKFIQEITPLVFKFLQPFQKIAIQSSWGNILQGDNHVEEHDHVGSNISGLLYLTDIGPGTDFPDFKRTIKEEAGKFILFHSHSLHGVKKTNLNEKRYSLAFNLYATKYWE
tara:strand:- start:267 stop:797 length:531 start_codon:yes stop_codon:yes gene_type:complete